MRIAAHLKPKFYDPVGFDPSHCDQCGAEATMTAGWNPDNQAMMVMVRCDEHALSRRELDAVSAAILQPVERQ